MNYNVEWCPNCGSHRVNSELTHDPLTLDMVYRVRCQACDLAVFGYDTEKEAVDAWNKYARERKGEPEKENPYTDFAKEMSLLHEALKAEGFKDAMVDILAAMSPVVWDKVYGPTFEEAVEKEVQKIRMNERIEKDLLLRHMRKGNKRRYGRTEEVEKTGGGTLEVDC